MASVDDRIVRLQFDNSQFQNKINDTLTSISKLDKALKFEGAQKGMADISAAAGKMNFQTISDGIENVSKKFLALSTIAITILAGIASKAAMAGAQIAKSLSLDSVIAGFREYETNITSIQTILANTKAQGTNLEQVNAALDQLNQYSDKTIYNFGQMAKNIGTFTAAGVDLDLSVQSIKGIANLAAISGSSADQASTAMYQLSQAIASGSVKLMDWNSVVNAGMGGKGFQEALFNTGKALKTIPGVPIGQTFKQWTDAGNTFRDSLQDGWVTADVLTTTLQGYTGEMTEAQLVSKGFTADAARQMVELGNTGVDAATKVRTFTGLMATTKESIGSGWSASFRILIGTFTEATDLFTGLSQAIGNVVSKSADARNALLQSWKDLGGRTMLIDGLKTAFHNLGEIIQPIKEAFREIFPRTTSQELIEMTKSFVEFAKALKPSQETIDNLKSIFKGFFSILSIGWTIIKEGVKFIADLGQALIGLAGGDFLAFMAKVGDFFTNLRDILVTGGGISAFFEGLSAIIAEPIGWLDKLKKAIASLFGGFDTGKADEMDGVLEGFGSKFESLGRVVDAIQERWKSLDKFFTRLSAGFAKIGQVIGDFFSTIGSKIAQAMNSGNFDEALDALNTGIFAVLTGAIIKWFRSGFNIKFGLGGGFFDNIAQTFDQLTGVLQALQVKIKSEALMKIAIAIGVLTASVLVLSMIDSAALTKALTAMAVGFAQLMGAFAILTKLTLNPKMAASFGILAVGMIALASALLILSVAAAILAKLDWGELARGLTGTVVLIGLMVGAAHLLSGATPAMIRAGIGLAAMSVGLVLMSAAIKVFASMSWEELAKGLLGLAAGLGLIVVALLLMPPHMALIGIGLVGVGAGLIAMGTALKIFGGMSWSEIGRGLVALAGGLALIAAAMYAMPDGMITIGIGLNLVGAGLVIFARALKSMGAMSWEEISRGLVALGASLLILAVGVGLMTSSLAGAAALVIVSGALLVLAGVLKLFAALGWDDLLEGLGKLGVALAAIAIAALLLQPAIPAILGLGAALAVLGIAFALFGTGAFLVAKAFELIAKVGTKAADQLGEVFEALGRAIPAFATGIAEGMLNMIQTFADGIAKIIPSFAKIIGGILTAIQMNLPKVLEIFGQLLDGIINLIYQYGPQFITMGLFLLVTLLQGVRDNIKNITGLVVEIIVGFINALSENIGFIVGAGARFFAAFLQGIADNILLLAGTVANIIITFIVELGSHANKIVTAGVNTIIAFIEGLSKNGLKLADAAFTILTQFLNGLADVIDKRSRELREAGIHLAEAIISGITFGWSDKVGEVWDSIGDFASEAKDKLTHPWDMLSPSKVTRHYGAMIAEGFAVGFDKDTTVEHAATDLMERTAKVFETALVEASNYVSSLDELNPVLTPVLDLTKVAADAKLIEGYIQTTQKITPNVSLNQARVIASSSSEQPQPNAGNSPEGTSGVTFVQTINSPTQLATADIYKQTRNQITLAKEELAIP